MYCKAMREKSIFTQSLLTRWNAHSNHDTINIIYFCDIYSIHVTPISRRKLSMINMPKCPQCSCEYTYEDHGIFMCPECAHEWNQNIEGKNTEHEKVIKDAHGNILHDGDSVALIKDLKIKGGSSTIKAGTKVKNIRLVDEDHNIDCKIDSFGKMGLKSEFVKKIE